MSVKNTVASVTPFFYWKLIMNAFFHLFFWVLECANGVWNVEWLFNIKKSTDKNNIFLLIIILFKIMIQNTLINMNQESWIWIQTRFSVYKYLS